MESYTFRCTSDGCNEVVAGITMYHVVESGVPICGECGDDLELVGSDNSNNASEARIQSGALHNPGVTATESRMIAEELAARTGLPNAYSTVPGGPVNPENVEPLSHVLQYQTCGEGKGGNATCDVCGACYCLPPWTMGLIIADEVCPGVTVNPPIGD